jgi:uncharacterized membrane protein YqjE
MAAAPVRGDPDLGIPDLIRRLTQDSKRLVADEVRLAKIDATDSLHRAARGVLWMALAFGVAVVMFVALTLFVATLIGRLANGHMWIGALVTGLLELGVGLWLVKRGITAMVAPSYSLEASRNALADTANWMTSGRKH